MFQVFSSISQGMFLVDRTGRIVWINEGYKRFLPALGFSSVDQFLGHMVEDVVPNTQMRRVLETGQAVLIDLLTNRAGTFVVSRLPLRDERTGELIGAMGIVLFDHPETTLQPLISKFAHLQRDLDDARRELASQRRTKYTLASFVGGHAPNVRSDATRAESRLVALNAMLEVNCAVLIDRLAGLRNLDAFSSSSEPPKGSPGYFGSSYTDANGAYWQEINLQALSQQPQFLSISA